MVTKKKKLISTILTTIIVIAYLVTTTTTIVFAVLNYFQSQSKHEVKVRLQFPMLEVKEAQSQDISTNKELNPLVFPILDNDTDTHTVKHNFETKLHSKNARISKKLYLKTDLSYVFETKCDSGSISNETLNNLFNSEVKVNGNKNNDNQRALIAPDKTYLVQVSTEQEDFMPRNVTHFKLWVKVDYEIVDEDGKSLEGAKGTVQKQVQTQGNQ